MQRLFKGLLAAGSVASVLASTVAADPASDVASDAPSDDAAAAEATWAGLDQELVSLSSAALASDGPSVGGYIRSAYQASKDDPFQVDGEDSGGWVFRAVRLEVKGEAGEGITWKVSVDFKSGEGDLKDAYVDWQFTEDVGLKWGQFKEPLLYSGLSSGSRQLFIDRTALGGINDERDHGAMLHGEFGEDDMFQLYAAVQNGSDGIADDYTVTARGVANVLGDGAFGKYQGAYDFDGATGASVGVAYQDDGAADNGDFFVVDLGATMENFWAYADFADVSDDYDGPKAGTTPFKDLIPDTTPWSVTLSYLFYEDELEAALRYEDADDTDDTSRITGGLNWFPVETRNVKWQVNVVSQDSDSDAYDGTNFLLGLVARI